VQVLALPNGRYLPLGGRHKSRAIIGETFAEQQKKYTNSPAFVLSLTDIRTTG
jgi:hypothetical protein